MMVSIPQSVAVIGAGTYGLAAAKNFLEVGLDVTVFEKRDSIAGLWVYTDEVGVTSVLKSTVANATKYKNQFTDFPFPEEASPHPTAAEIRAYFEAYAKEFDLHRHIRLNSPVEKITRNDQTDKWVVHVIGDKSVEELEFDKVALCNGCFTRPRMPTFQGREMFEGRVLHSQDFKRPEDFTRKSVIVVGLGNSAADVATSLVGYAKKISLSHRRGAVIVRRMYQNKPIELIMTRRAAALHGFISAISPRAAQWVQDWMLTRISRAEFPTADPAWRLHDNAPSTSTHLPLVSDTLVDHLASGDIESVPRIAKFTGASTVQLDDGRTLKGIDAVVCCTGYGKDLSLVDGLDLTQHAPSVPGFEGAPLAHLYQNTFPPSVPSIAVLNHVALNSGIIPIADLHTMAVAQVWIGAVPLPSEAEMHAAAEAHARWVCSLGERDTVYTDIVDMGPWLRWLHGVAGTGVNENLGWGWEGWKFWYRERRLCGLLMDGIDAPAGWRLFEGRRKRWEGAREEIVRANEEVGRRFEGK